MKYFEVKVKYKDVEYKNITDNYLFDSISWTESEALTVKQMQSITDGDYVIDAIKKSKVAEVFGYEFGDTWFKVMVEMIIFDEESAREKQVKEVYLVAADDIEQAILRTKENIDNSTVPYVISSAGVSNIVDVFLSEKENER